MAAKDGVLIRRRLRIFAVAVALVLLCAVCVGAVSGAELHVSATPHSGWYTSLAEAVNAANIGDIIIIEDDEYTITQQVWLGPKQPRDGTTTKSITITNKPGKHVTIKSGLTGGVDARTLFIITGGTLTIEGGNQGGSLTITTNYNGRAFDVNFDARDRFLDRYNDDISSNLIIHDNVDIIRCGFSSVSDDDGGAIYIRPDGECLMYGGRLLYNTAGAGGAVIVDGGKFTMDGGLVYGNTALDTSTGGWYNSRGGGGIYITDNSGECDLMGGVIYGNSAKVSGEEYQQVYGGSYNKAVPWISHDGELCEFFTISQAYTDNSFTGNIYIHADLTQFPDEYITVNKALTIRPAGQSVKLVLTESSETGGMFEVTSSGSLTFEKNGNYLLTVSGSNKLEGKGGAVYVNGGTFTLSEGVTMSGLKAADGGAIYLNNGVCTLAGGTIQDCMVSGKGNAIYVAGGTLTVAGSASVDASNDVYLSEGQVITANSGYAGNVGKITLSSYTEGRNVVDVTADSDISITKFTLNPEAHNEYGDKLLVHVVEDGKDFLELKTQPVYRITIPDSLHISSEDKYGTMLITAETVKIPINSWLSVTVVSEGNFNLTNTADNSAKLPYNLFIDESGVRVKNNLEVAHFTVTEYLEKQSVSSKLTERLNGTVTELPPVTGTYTDILTFTVEYKTT